MKRTEEFVSKFRIINTDWSVWQYANYKCLDAEPTEPEYIYIYVDNDRALISRPFSVLSFRFVICGDHPTFPCVGLLSSHWCFTFSLLMVQMIHICRRVSSSMFARMKSSFRQSGVFFPSSSVIVNTGAWHARKIFSPQNMQVTASSKTLMHFNKPVMRPKKTRKVRSFSRDESMASNGQRSSAVSLDLMHMKAKPHKSMERKLLRMTGSLRGAWEGNCCGVLSQTRSFTWSWHRKSNSFRGKVQLPDDILHSSAPVGVVSDRKSSWNMMGPMKSVSPVENLSHPRQSLEVSEEPCCSCHGMSIFFWTFIVHVVNLTKIG